MKRKQVRNLVVALGLTAALGGGATLALLTAQTGTVTNTFTVGKNLQASDLLLNEADLIKEGEGANRKADDTKPRVTTLGFKDLMQGDVMDKDPTVQIKPDAAECYMFIKVEGLDKLKACGITTDIADEGAVWVKADGANTLDGYYYYKGTGTDAKYVLNPASDALTDKKWDGGKGLNDLDPLFTTVTVAKDAAIYNADGTSKSLENIVVKACAVQAQNVDSVQLAYGELPDGF